MSTVRTVIPQAVMLTALGQVGQQNSTSSISVINIFLAIKCYYNSLEAKKKLTK